MKRMVLNEVAKEDLVQGEVYLLTKGPPEEETIEALWDGEKWVLAGELQVGRDADWPEAVFRHPNRACVTREKTLDEHQQWVKEHAFFEGGDITYPTLGLCGEAGEFAEKVKKSIRDDGGKVTPERRLEMVRELGDTLFYLCECARRLGATLSEVAEENVRKLKDRRQRGTLRGSGDVR